MIYGQRVILIVVLAVFLQQCVKAQDDNANRYLHKTGVVDSLYSKTLNETRTIYIQIPESYSPEHKQKYPVVYIVDGEFFLPTVDDVHRYYSGGFMPEMVLVGISNAENRTRDLTTSKVETMYGMPYNEKSGEADNFNEFLTNELIPFIEDKYPVNGYRTLIGHSYGGLFALYSLIHYPGVFANYLAIDPSLDWDNQKLLKQANEILPTQNYKNKALFISLSGQLHMQNADITIDNVMQDSTDFTLFARSNIAFSNLVKQNISNGLSYEWKFYPDDLHGTVPFPSILDGLISIFEWYQMENTDRINSFDSSTEELLSIIKYREKKLKDHFGFFVPPYPEDLLNMSGYMNMDFQNPDKAKMYFEMAIEYYPESANAYDSMSDYYEAQGDITNAIAYAEKAYALSGMDLYQSKISRLKKK